MRPTRIISGGQTGADLAGLRAGKALGIPTGGWMPKNFRNELGVRGWMREQFGMQEHASPHYNPRTLANVKDADVTLIFGTCATPGTRVTLNYCNALRKVRLVNPTPSQLFALCGEYQLVVNVAGNRESGNRGIEAYVYRLLIEAWARPEQIDALRRAAPWPDPLPRLTTALGDPMEAPHVTLEAQRPAAQ